MMQPGLMDQGSTGFPQPFPPTTIWIFGAGKFGTIAARRLKKRYLSAHFLVVDSEAEKLERISNELGLPVHLEDALSFFTRAQAPNDLWIVPAVPAHVAYEWMLSELGKAGRVNRVPVPQAVDTQVPNPFRVKSSTLYASFATFVCPDACSEPRDICTFTKEPRLGNLFEVLRGIQVPGYSVVVVRSWQLAPGVGGLTVGYLKEKLAELKVAPGYNLVATSCRCHGVLDALEWIPH